VSDGFRAGVRRALADEGLQEALDRNAERRRAGRVAGFAGLADADAVRRRATEIRRNTIADLDQHLDLFVSKLESAGVVVHRAADAAEACRIIVGILTGRRARKVVKAKSMVSEEIRLNRSLEAAGLEVIETDLGEFIVQLRGERPTHITAPALHLRREDVGRTFEEHLGLPFTTDVEAMTAAARRILRRQFFEADAGISGVNFGVAETGTLCLVTNEGNGRMVAGLPPLHVAVMGLERIVPSMTDLAVMLDVLPRAATGQARTSYISLISGVRRPTEADGPCQRHVVIVDDGRLALRDSPFAESLACIRCGACLNACPVYQEIGGRGYGSVYPGPIGAVISPWIFGQKEFGHLARASTLCGACRDVCPVGIDLPSLLVRERATRAGKAGAPRTLALGARLFAWAIADPGRYRLAQRAASFGSRLLPRRGSWLKALPGPLGNWTRSRDFPAFATKPFREEWERFEPEKAEASSGPPPEAPLSPGPGHAADGDLRRRFVQALKAVGGEVVDTTADAVGDAVLGFLRQEGAQRVLAEPRGTPLVDGVVEYLRQAGVDVQIPDLTGEPAQRRSRLDVYDGVTVGVTGASAGLADAGSLVLGGRGNSQLPSLLPPTHLALLPAADILPSLQDWARAEEDAWRAEPSTAAIVTGPSRTADIEMTLTIGVHGPRRVVVFLVD
jgi:L-lactate dehydrogenase complex protein LldF